MKIIVLVPSRDYVNNAGARIRYGRLPSESAGDLQLVLEDIDRFDPRTAEADVLIISKCHDARSLLAAIVCSRRGMMVGVDLFDDYFSQSADSRLNRFRLWLRQLLVICDFAMCSTQMMADVAATYRRGIPTLILNDPAPAVDEAQLAQSLDRKLAEVRAEGRVRLAWFGVGDNPHFPVGLSDLAAFAPWLAQLGELGHSVELSILTNARALDVDGLAKISQLPVPFAVDEWSEQAEEDLLRRSLVCFLPVNAQRFSAAKSLNRAITALSAGCQVLSAGYPLYAALDQFIYRDPRDFSEDLRSGKLRLGVNSMASLRQALDQLASPRLEREKLRSFLLGLPGRGGKDESGAPLHLVHGYATNGAAHKMVQAVGGLSVASPFCRLSLDFDVMFEMRPGLEVAMLVSDKGLSRMRPEPRARASVFGAVAGRNFWEIRRGGSSSAEGGTAWSDPSLSLQLALYPQVMEAIGEALSISFGTGRTIVSENSTLPFQMVN